MSTDQEELQRLSQQLEAVESRLEALHTEVQTLQSRKSNIDEAIDAIETLESDATVQVPVGGGAYIRATVEDIDEVIVGIGGGYATEGSESAAISHLEDRQDRIDDRIADLHDAIAELEAQGEELGQEAQERLQRLQQEQAQQQGGLGGALQSDE